MEQAIPKSNYPERDITFIVPYGPGGGFDTYARMLQPFIVKYLPRKVNIVVKNVAGAESRLGLMEIYKANPDGYTIGFFDIPGQVTGQIVGKVQYDLNKVTWLTRVTTTPTMIALAPSSPYRTLQDLQKATLVKAGSGGLGTTAGQGVVISSQAMGIKVNIIPGDGTQDSVLAAMRGDVDLIQYPYTSLLKSITDKELLPLLVFSEKRLEDLPDVPTISELGYPELTKIIKIDYLIGGPPGIPEEVRTVLEEAIWKAINDPEFMEMAKKGKRPIISPLRGKDAARVIQDSFDGFSKYKDILAQYVK